jgi:hypothetical protein
VRTTGALQAAVPEAGGLRLASQAVHRDNREAAESALCGQPRHTAPAAEGPRRKGCRGAHDENGRDIHDEHLETGIQGAPGRGRAQSVAGMLTVAGARQSLQRRIQTHEASLRRQFPAYADAFVVDALIGVLYAIGFLGVKRGNDVVYAGGAHAGIQPSESEFHIHSCFRVALDALDASDIQAFQADVDAAHGVQVGDRNLQVNYFGRDIAISLGRDSYLLEALAEARTQYTARFAAPIRATGVKRAY